MTLSMVNIGKGLRFPEQRIENLRRPPGFLDGKRDRAGDV
jgi:hypothetical protein